ncbi:MAG: VOC family protein [Acidimicrobiales bacterium]
MGTSWGHLNINVSDLGRSIEFYERLGFSMMIEAIPHLGLSLNEEATLTDALCVAYGLPIGTRALGCILQLDHGLPKLDLTQYVLPDAAEPLVAGALGCERLCLAVRDLPAEIDRLERAGVTFVGGAASGALDLAQVAVCLDPDGTRIELIQLDLRRFVELGYA